MNTLKNICHESIEISPETVWKQHVEVQILRVHATGYSDPQSNTEQGSRIKYSCARTRTNVTLPKVATKLGLSVADNSYLS